MREFNRQLEKGFKQLVNTHTRAHISYAVGTMFSRPSSGR